MIIKAYDTEVKKSPDEVGWKNYGELGMSVGVVVQKEYKNGFINKEVKIFEDPIKMVEDLNHGDLVIGFNNESFDDELLCHFAGNDHNYLFNRLDILKALDSLTNIRYSTSLGKLSEMTIGRSKIEDGAQAPKLWQEGKTERLANYCVDDAELVMQLFEFGVNNGYVLIHPNSSNPSLFGNLVLKVNVGWKGLVE